MGEGVAEHMPVNRRLVPGLLGRRLTIGYTPEPVIGLQFRVPSHSARGEHPDHRVVAGVLKGPLAERENVTAYRAYVRWG